MKICLYCDSENVDSARVCSACGAAAFKNKCNNCGTVFESAFCPACGTKAGSQAKVCPQCGERYFSPACPKCGHNGVVKRSQKQEDGEAKRIIVQHVSQADEKPKKKVTFGKILLWIFFLPIMAIVAVWQSKRLAGKWKLLLTALIAALSVLFYYGNGSTEEKQTTVLQSSVSKTMTQAQPTTTGRVAPQATANETAAPVQQARNGFREGTTKHTIASYSVSVPNCFGEPTQSSTESRLQFADSEGQAVLILQFVEGKATRQEFDAQVEQRFLDLFEDVELTSSEETKIAGLPGRILNATGYYSNMHVNVRAGFSLDENQQGMLGIIVIQGDNSLYDYNTDFRFMVRSVSKVKQDTSTKQSTPKEQKNANTASDELKKVLDGYEAFVDSYCAFMKKYSESNDVSGMAMEYINMLAKLSDWADRIDQIDEDKLSETDLLYYGEVMLRCTNKMLQATGY